MRHEASGSIKVPTGELLPLLLFFNWALLNAGVLGFPVGGFAQGGNSVVVPALEAALGSGIIMRFYEIRLEGEDVVIDGNGFFLLVHVGESDAEIPLGLEVIGRHLDGMTAGGEGLIQFSFLLKYHAE